LRGGARQPGLRRISRGGPQLARPFGAALRPQGAPQTDGGDRAVAALEARVGARALEVPRRLARIAAREQRLGEKQPRVAAAPFAAGPGELVEIVELRRGGGAREGLVQIGVAQVDHAEHELRLRPALAVEARLFDEARRLFVAALLVELHRRADRVVGGPRTERCGEKYE